MNVQDRARTALLPILSIAIVFVVLEILLAFFWPHKIKRHSYQIENGEYHNVLGWRNKPNLDGEVVNRDIRFHRKHNSKGLRSPREIGYERTPGAKRILLLGDSFFWGYGVNDEDVVSEVLQRKAGMSVEIINGAVIGYGTDQELLWLVEEGLKYKPDLVVLGLYGFNDYEETSTSVCYGYPKPIFSLNKGKLALGNVPVPDTRETRRKGFNEPDTAWGKVKKYLRHHTHTYPFIAGRLNSIPALRNLLVSTGLADENTRSLPGVPHYTLSAEKRREMVEALIRSIRDIAKQELGADFLLVSIPTVETDPDNRLLCKGNIDWNKRSGENTEFNGYIKRYAARNGIRFLDLLPTTREHMLKGDSIYNPYAYDHHWSAAGHKMAAEELYEYLQKTGWVGRR